MNRYDIITGRPGRLVHEVKPKRPPDVSFLSNQDFIEFVQKEIKRREESNNTKFVNQVSGLTGIGIFITREQYEANIIGYADISYAGIRVNAGIVGTTGVQGVQGYTQGSTNLEGV